MDIVIATSHGQQIVSMDDNERVIDCLLRYQLPWTAVAMYIKRPSGHFDIYPCLEKFGHEMPKHSVLYAFHQRNVDPFKFAINELRVLAEGSDQYVADYLFFDGPVATKAHTVVQKLTSNQCKKMVSSAVLDVLEQQLPDNFSVIVGISGGGDSNALLNGLYQARADLGKEINIIPVIIKGIPEWDKGVPRALQLCHEYGFTLRVVEPDEMFRLLGINSPPKNIVNSFFEHIPDEDFEFFGEAMLIFTLSAIAREMNVSYVCFGYNFEDLLAGYLRLAATGNAMTGVPIAEGLYGTRYLYPLWLVPKKIIDGCFPKLSFENYEARYPSFAEGRNFYYHAAYHISAYMPQLGESLLRNSQSVTRLIPDYNQSFIESISNTPNLIKDKLKLIVGDDTPGDFNSA